MKISIIVPVYNEEKTILKVLKRLNQTKLEGYDYQLIVINDGSTDSTQKILNENSLLYSDIINYDKNYGKGYAVKEALKIANGDYVTFQDADLEYDPKEFQKFLKISKNFDADVIIGSRFNYSEYTRSHNIMNKFGNYILTFIFNILYNTTFTDIYSCYLFFKKDLLDIHKLNAYGFDQHAEILCEVIKKGLKFYEVPISYNGRTSSEGKKIKFYHFFSVVYRIISKRF